MLCFKDAVIRGMKVMRYMVEIIILLFLWVYFIAGVLQLFTAKRIKREASSTKFTKKDCYVSVVIPIRGIYKGIEKNLISVCIQDHLRYEVIFVAESPRHAAYPLASDLAKRYSHVRILISGEHDPKKNIAKCHNLVRAVSYAKGDVLLFGDSDVYYPRDWIAKMTSPLGEYVNGRRIDATTAPFFIEPDGFWGKLIALSVSFVTFTTAFTRENQRFPPYASGASIAVTQKLFASLKISDIWESSFNDDLVFANTLISNGNTIYNQHNHLNHPNELFVNFRQTMDKLIRWVITVSHFGHRRLKEETPILVAKNLQFQVSLILAVFLFLGGFPLVFVLIVLFAGYIYSVLYRWGVGMLVEERGMSPYYVLAPFMGVVLIFFYVFVRAFYIRFSWEGENYYVKS